MNHRGTTNIKIKNKVDLPITEYILKRIGELENDGHPPRTLFAVCPNSIAVIKAALRSAKRNNAPLKFATTLNQVDCDRGYTNVLNYDEDRAMVTFPGAMDYLTIDDISDESLLKARHIHFSSLFFQPGIKNMIKTKFNISVNL